MNVVAVTAFEVKYELCGVVWWRAPLLVPARHDVASSDEVHRDRVNSNGTHKSASCSRVLPEKLTVTQLD